MLCAMGGGAQGYGLAVVVEFALLVGREAGIVGVMGE